MNEKPEKLKDYDYQAPRLYSYKTMRKIREKLYHKQEGKCAYCGVDVVMTSHHPMDFGYDPNLAVTDHILPLCRGGATEEENLCVVCCWCNCVKGKKSLEEFLEYIQPMIQGVVPKCDLKQYNLYKKLRDRFKQQYLICFLLEAEASDREHSKYINTIDPLRIFH